MNHIDFSKYSTIRRYIDMIWCSPGRFIYLTDKVDEPEKNTDQ